MTQEFLNDFGVLSIDIQDRPKRILLLATVMCFAQNPQIGTWKLNESKSKIPPGAAKNHTVIYEVAGDSIKITVDGVDANGSATHNEWTGKFDGKDYPVTGDSTADMRSYKLVNARTLTFSNKKAGKVTLSGRVVVSRDGNTRTVTTTATNNEGKKITSVRSTISSNTAVGFLQDCGISGLTIKSCNPEFL